MEMVSKILTLRDIFSLTKPNKILYPPLHIRGVATTRWVRQLGHHCLPVKMCRNFVEKLLFQPMLTYAAARYISENMHFSISPWLFRSVGSSDTLGTIYRTSDAIFMSLNLVSNDKQPYPRNKSKISSVVLRVWKTPQLSMGGWQ